ncbi:MAG: alpha/beta fold hydrolase [Moraxellaceae bacterium]|nr:MAG: alpha/beta fold hydrolase [Moraxellaceae bacterium]
MIFSMRPNRFTTHPGFLLIAKVHCLLLSLICGSLAASIIRTADTMWIYYGVGILTGVISHLLFVYFFNTKSFSIRQSLTWLIACYVAFYILVYYVLGPWLWLHFRFNPRDSRHSICCETPADYGANNYETLQLNGDDAAVIAGWYIAPTQQPGKVIVLIHGSGYDRRGTDFYARILIKQGYGILMYDLRNHGESSGSANTFNRLDKMQSDLGRVLVYLQSEKHIEPQRIGVVGISLGGFATLNLPADIINRIGPLWLDGIRSDNFGTYTAENMFINTAKQLFDSQTRLFAQLLTREPIADRPQSFRQVFPLIARARIQLVASGLDKQERATNENFTSYLSDTMALWIIPNAWHIGGRFDAAEEYEQRMIKFFGTYL